MFVDTFITRPILASVCSLVIVLAGALAIPTMPVAQYPAVAPPQVQVIAVYTGANAETVETAVTTPLEQAINGVEGMLYMSSASTNSGFSQISVTFDVTRDPDLAAVDVQNRVNQALGRLPGEVRQTGVSVQKVATNFVLGAGVFSESGAYDSLFLSNYVDVYVKDALKRVPGVAEVMIFGERKYSMRLWLDPVRLAARQITAGDVVNALREQNVNVAAGSIGEAPAREGQTYQISVRAAGRLREAREFENIIVKSARSGALVRVSDVGTAELGAETYASTLRFNGFDAVGFGVIALPSANALEVEHGVVAELERLKRSFPPGMQYRIAFNTTDRGRPVDQRGHQDAGRGHRPRRPGDVPLPPELAGDAHPDADAAGLADRRVRVRQAPRLLDQHAHAVRHRALDRHRRRRCDRGDRERRAAHPEGQDRVQGGLRRHARGVRRRHRHGARADCRVRAGGILPRHDRPAVPAVRADDRVRGGDLGVQRADADARAVGPPAQERQARQGPVLRGHRARHPGRDRLLRAHRTRAHACPLGDGGGLRRPARPHLLRVSRVSRSRSCPRRTRGFFITVVQAPAGASLELHDQGGQRGRGGAAGNARSAFRLLGHGLQLQRQRTQPGPDLRVAEAVRGTRRRRAPAAGRAEPAARADVRHPGRPGDPLRAARPSTASARSAASPSRCSTRAAAPISSNSRAPRRR